MLDFSPRTAENTEQRRTFARGWN